ncbi:phosphorothioated DNA-binding restriction endonuclease [Streptomyces sp. CBMA123]|uniref:phosphorothioated DNA-binding restriction endonuclease n=1 Tax=Streptomyces sp. CBMA123 TaxID=1896313 RepID=UPI001661DD6A|nr:HNH endonuclease [Streptomyces sp. CBMA123]MBD0689747.1 restriction endonuclease [Streptomyces sp. CBMA123]
MDWLDRVAGLRRWTGNGVRAPHKPLLLLYALGCYQRDAGGELRYSVVEEELKRLLVEYGPSHATTPAYPFHHLVSDGVWEVRTDRGPGSPGSGVGLLRASGAAGMLASGLREALGEEPALLGRLARVLLDAHFPTSLHAELCEAVGLDLERAETGVELAARRQRDRRMRELILTAYEFQCAFCGYDGALGASVVGLEAAHVRWWSHQGPDEVDNGLCLCSLHHKLFDKGVLGLGEERRILVSQRFVGRSEASRRQVLSLAGRPLIGPQAGAPSVADRHREWHARQVFHGAARQPVGAGPG